MDKPVVKIRYVYLVPAEEIFGEGERGNFVVRGSLAEVDHRGWPKNTEIRTSLVVNVDIKGGIIETLNTIYQIVE
jgi:hypothetical protein